MASERDREIWDDATNAVCQAMQEQKMCNCPDGDCLAAKIDFSPEKIATATRPAPAATDTGLETLSVELTPSGHPYMKSDQEGDYVTRSQAEELLAAERAESDRLRKLFKTQSAVHSKHVKELIAKHERERETYGQAAQDFRERAEKAEADNAAKDARVKELEEENKSLTEEWYRGLRVQQKISDRAEALEAKLAAAEKVREAAIELDEAISDDFNIFGAQQKLRAALGGKP